MKIIELLNKANIVWIEYQLGKTIIKNNLEEEKKCEYGMNYMMLTNYH